MKRIHKRLKGFKTFVFAALQFIAGIVLVLDPEWVVEAIEGQAHGYVMIGSAFVTGYLRIVTNTPAGQGATNDHTDIDTFQGGL